MKEREVIQSEAIKKNSEFFLNIQNVNLRVENITNSPLPQLSILGPEGTNTDQAAAEFFGESYKKAAEIISVREEENNIRLVESVIEGRSDMAIVPTESSSGGNVQEPLMMIAKSSVNIIGEKVIPIEHMLASFGKKEDVSIIRSHPQAIRQSSKWLKENFPHAILEEAGSTAGAVRDLARYREMHIAAIGNKRAAEIYQVPLLSSEAIGNDKDSATRFWLIGNGESEPTGSDKTTFTFRIPDTPGSLVNSLENLNRNNINLKKLISIEADEDSVQFLATIDGHAKDFNISSAIKQIENITQMHILGSYSADKYATPENSTPPAISADMLEKAKQDTPHRKRMSSLNLLFTTLDSQGSLLRAISPLAKAGVNILHINSIESGRGMDEYGFRIDLDLHGSDSTDFLIALNEFRSQCSVVKELT